MCGLFTLSAVFELSICQQNWIIFWGYTQLIIKYVMPNYFHVIPIDNYTFFDWAFQVKNNSFRLGFIPNITVFFFFTISKPLLKLSLIILLLIKYVIELTFTYIKLENFYRLDSDLIVI